MRAALFLISMLLLAPPVFPDEEKPFIIGLLRGQLGNQMFQIAATCALAWDNNADPCFPDLVQNPNEGIPENYRHLFFRCNPSQPTSPISFFWKQPSPFRYFYNPIPYHPNMQIEGVLQSEGYFAHHRDKILQLFSPREEDLAYIREKYKEILDHPNTVGVQVRNFGIPKDRAAWGWGAQYGYDYFNKAMARFPDDALFVVSTNDRPFALRNVPKNKNVIFLENEPYHIEFILLTLLKHNIISNSTFGWWAAWLNQNPDKVVVVPRKWIGLKHLRTHVWPDGWIQINAKWGKPHSPLSTYR